MEFNKNQKTRSGDRIERASSFDVIEISNLESAERFKASGGIVLASLFAGQGATLDASSPGLHQTRSFDASDPGLCSRALALPKVEQDRLLIGIAKPNKVAKAFVVGLMAGEFKHEGCVTKSGVDLRELAKVIDAFDRDLVDGWPKGSTREEKTLMVANRYFSRMMAVEDLSKSVFLLKELIEAPNFEHDYAEDLQSEKERVELAQSFRAEVVRGSKLSISIIEETDPAGFHPGVYCQKYNADLTLVIRSDLKLSESEGYLADGFISGFAAVSTAKKIDPELGLRAVTAQINRLGILTGGVALDRWGGDETRFGWNRGLQVPRGECLQVARDVAQLLSGG